MHWTVVVKLAKLAEDVTYEEWCELYVSFKKPTQEQINTASQSAHAILVRNKIIKSDVVVDTQT